MKQRTLALSLPAFAILVATPAVAFGAGVDGPALIAWQPTYNQGLPNLGVHGPGCRNLPERMPAGRQQLCGPPALTALGPGRYQITTPNGAPFPDGTEDTGWLAFATSIEGGASQCFEESTTVTDGTLDTIVRCVDETGSDVDTTISWSYRADSLANPQTGAYVPNLAYARVERDGTLNAAESFNPLSLHDDDILAVKSAGTGEYTVTFKDLNPLDAKLEPSLAPYNVLVQKTCAGDTANGADPDGCFRSVCAVTSWTPGDFETWDTTVNVRCVGADGAPRDTSFRVFFGDGAYNSQGPWQGDDHFGWADFSLDPSSSGCHEAPDITGNSQHELPLAYPGLPVEVCREALGVYQVNFTDTTLTPYSVDGMNTVISSRETDGTHCNVQQIRCPASFNACGIPGTSPTTRVTVGCFDPSGAPADARFDMAMTY